MDLEMRIAPDVDLSAIPPKASNDWRQIPARPVDRWYLGLDIGQSVDPSAAAALNHVIKPLGLWRPQGKTWREDFEERFLVRHLERLPLQMSYPRQVAHVADLLQRDPLKGATFALDYTGCGRPVADMFSRAGLHPQCILITAGNAVTRAGGSTWHCPKGTLISALEARLHSGELRIAAALTDAPALRDELKDFARKVSDAGRVTFNARSGAHDDLILAICIAVFAATGGRSTSSTEQFLI